jgi:hypothetical protein
MFRNSRKFGQVRGRRGSNTRRSGTGWSNREGGFGCGLNGLCQRVPPPRGVKQTLGQSPTAACPRRQGSATDADFHSDEFGVSTEIVPMHFGQHSPDRLQPDGVLGAAFTGVNVIVWGCPSVIRTRPEVRSSATARPRAGADLNSYVRAPSRWPHVSRVDWRACISGRTRRGPSGHVAESRNLFRRARIYSTLERASADRTRCHSGGGGAGTRLGPTTAG